MEDSGDERGGWLSRFRNGVSRPAEQTPEANYSELGGHTPAFVPICERPQSFCSVASVLPPERPYLKRLKAIVVLMMLTTVLNTVTSSWLTYITGNTQEYYLDCLPPANATQSPLDIAPGTCHAWQFCLIYADTLVGEVDAQLPFYGLTQSLSTLGMQVCGVFPWGKYPS